MSQGIAGEIKRRREALDLAVSDVAAAVGLSSDQYEDLETDDDEVFMAVTINQVLRLGDLLGVRIHELVGRGEFEHDEGIGIREFLAIVRRHMASRNESIDEFSERVGWDVAAALADPDVAGAEWNLDCLRDISAGVSVDWRLVLSGMEIRMP